MVGDAAMFFFWVLWHQFGTKISSFFIRAFSAFAHLTTSKPKQVALSGIWLVHLYLSLTVYSFFPYVLVLS
jgi:hypothetical protein